MHVLITYAITYLRYAAFSNDKRYLGSLSHDKMLKVRIFSLSQYVCPCINLTWHLVCIQLWDLQELLNCPQAVNGAEPAESGSDDSDDDNGNDDDGMDLDTAPTSLKGRTTRHYPTL